jgi:hypothetical protein
VLAIKRDQLPDVSCQHSDDVFNRSINAQTCCCGASVRPIQQRRETSLPDQSLMWGSKPSTADIAKHCPDVLRHPQARHIKVTFVTRFAIHSSLLAIRIVFGFRPRFGSVIK